MIAAQNMQMHEFVTKEGLTTITYRPRPFESECLGNSSYEIMGWDGAGFAEAFSDWLQLEKLKIGDFVYLRLPADDIVSSYQANRAGFFFVECSVVPYMNLRRWNRDDYRRYVSKMHKIADVDFSQVEEIAATSFKGLRFNADPFIGDEIADMRYLRWVQNAFASGDLLIGLYHKGCLAAFSLLHPLEDGSIIYNLAAVHPHFKGSGMGLMLTASTLAYCQDAGYTTIAGGISSANCPILNVNAAMGFSFRNPTTVFHYHAE